MESHIRNFVVYKFNNNWIIPASSLLCNYYIKEVFAMDRNVISFRVLFRTKNIKLRFKVQIQKYSVIFLYQHQLLHKYVQDLKWR